MTDYGTEFSDLERTGFIINKKWFAIIICPNCRQPVELKKTLYIINAEHHWRPSTEFQRGWWTCRAPGMSKEAYRPWW
jgi:uncharacterized protein YbaR (Trm112 family)